VSSKFNISQAGDGLEYEGAHNIAINESDEYALEEALALKRQAGGEVTIMTMGKLRCQQVLYMGLAKGADRAIRIDADYLDSQTASWLLAEAISRQQYDIIFTGAESSDNMAAMAGVAIAERLHIPFAFAVTSVDTVLPGAIRVTMELGGGVSELLEIRLPAVLCVQTGVRSLSYVPARSLLQAQRRPIERLDTTALSIDESKVKENRKQKIVGFSPPGKTRSAEIIQGAPDEVARGLMEKLREAV
jgi:electron transfer flavoprotein beta subunit